MKLHENESSVEKLIESSVNFDNRTTLSGAIIKRSSVKYLFYPNMIVKEQSVQIMAFLVMEFQVHQL